MPFNRFRNSNIFSPSYDPRGDISPPPHALYKLSRGQTPTLRDDDIIPLTGLGSSTSTPVSRNNSFTMKALNPRSLSIRLKNRTSKSPSPSPSPSSCKQSHNSTAYRSHTDPLPTSTAGGGARPEFVYRPIHRTNYPAVVAETATTHGSRQSRHSMQQYNYIPAGKSARYSTMEVQNGLPAAPHPRSRSRAQAQSQARTHYALHDDDENRRSYDSYSDLDEGYITSWSRGEHADIYTSAAEEKKRRAARRLTTVMVPDADDIYG
ncbi:hypothetical protein BJX76DRAFT_358936 [Aspergillus varians]